MKEFNSLTRQLKTNCIVFVCMFVVLLPRTFAKCHKYFFCFFAQRHFTSSTLGQSCCRSTRTTLFNTQGTFLLSGNFRKNGSDPEMFGSNRRNLRKDGLKSNIERIRIQQFDHKVRKTWNPDSRKFRTTGCSDQGRKFESAARSGRVCGSAEIERRLRHHSGKSVSGNFSGFVEVGRRQVPASQHRRHGQVVAPNGGQLLLEKRPEAWCF